MERARLQQLRSERVPAAQRRAQQPGREPVPQRREALQRSELARVQRRVGQTAQPPVQVRAPVPTVQQPRAFLRAWERLPSFPLPAGAERESEDQCGVQSGRSKKAPLRHCGASP